MFNKSQELIFKVIILRLIWLLIKQIIKILIVKLKHFKMIRNLFRMDLKRKKLVNTSKIIVTEILHFKLTFISLRITNRLNNNLEKNSDKKISKVNL